MKNASQYAAYLITHTNRTPPTSTSSVLAQHFAIRVTNDRAGIESIILDRASASDYLDVCATLSPAFSGDVLMIRESGGGYLSVLAAVGRRELFALGVDDVAFYLTCCSVTDADDTAAFDYARLRMPSRTAVA